VITSCFTSQQSLHVCHLYTCIGEKGWSSGTERYLKVWPGVLVLPLFPQQRVFRYTSVYISTYTPVHDHRPIFPSSSSGPARRRSFGGSIHEHTTRRPPLFPTNTASQTAGGTLGCPERAEDSDHQISALTGEPDHSCPG